MIEGDTDIDAEERVKKYNEIRRRIKNHIKSTVEKRSISPNSRMRMKIE